MQGSLDDMRGLAELVLYRVIAVFGGVPEAAIWEESSESGGVVVVVDAWKCVAVFIVEYSHVVFSLFVFVHNN